jgi:hypothetical protein
LMMNTNLDRTVLQMALVGYEAEAQKVRERTPPSRENSVVARRRPQRLQTEPHANASLCQRRLSSISGTLRKRDALRSTQKRNRRRQSPSGKCQPSPRRSSQRI